MNIVCGLYSLWLKLPDVNLKNLPRRLIDCGLMQSNLIITCCVRPITQANMKQTIEFLK